MNDIKTRIENQKTAIKVAQDSVTVARAELKRLIADAKTERALARVVREDQKKLRAEKRKKATAERIAKMEAKLLALKSIAGVRKAQRKAGPVKTIVENGVAV